MMEAVGETPDGRQFYVLTQDENDGVCRVRTVMVMQLSWDVEDLAEDRVRPAPGRPATIRYFADIGARMDRVLNRIRGA
jgi:hypothetical protein